MIKGSITAKIILLFSGAFALVFIIVLLLVHVHMTVVEDDNQRFIYEEKINHILSVLQRQADRLEATKRVETYKETFQDSILKTLRATYYQSSGQKVYPFILAFNRDTVMHPAIPSGPNTQKDTPFVQKMSQMKDGDFDYVYVTGEKKWMIFRSFPEWHWIVGYAVPHDIKYAYAYKFRNKLAFILAFIMVAALLVLIVVITRITQPISILTEASKAIASGDLNHPVDIVQQDELGTLAKNFIHMRDQISDKIQSLRDMNKQLEQEVFEHAKSEDQIKRSLREKEVLLKEVHHRVKNNLAVISSLLSLQSKHIDNDKAIEVFEESKSRIQSMALVHEKLYQTEDFTYIDVGDYVHSLVRSVRSTFGAGKQYSVIVDIDKINLDIDTLIPCGLIMNELLTNIFKHAFVERDDLETGPEIKIIMKKIGGNIISLTVSDNGKGMPDGFDIGQSTGLGLQLVEILSSQIRGTLETKSESGAEFELVFPDKLDSAGHFSEC